jgi:hypothetical protein
MATLTFATFSPISLEFPVLKAICDRLPGPLFEQAPTMAERTIDTTVTFKHPFILAGLDGPQPAGTYSLETTEEDIPDVSFAAFRRTSTLLRLPAIARAGGTSEVVPVDPEELSAALAADGKL